MTDSENKLPTLVHFAADVWEHVCPVERLVDPLHTAGFPLLRGNDWVERQLQVYAERIDQADVVVVQRDFPRHEEAYRKVMDRARAQGKPVVYELDDLLIGLPGSHPDLRSYHQVRHAILG